MPLPFEEGGSTKTRTRYLSPKGPKKVRLRSTTIIHYITPNPVNDQIQELEWNFPNLRGRQVTVSENHKAWRGRSKGSNLSDIGGNFFTQKNYVEGLWANPVNSRGEATYFNGPTPWNTDKYQYSGAMAALNPAGIGFPSNQYSNLAALDVMGASAIAACKPTNSVADLSVFLGELVSEGLPKLAGSTLWKDKTLKAKKAGKEYLNQEFGWLPMSREIQDLASSVAHAEQVIAQYERDSGRVVRRRYSFPQVKSTEGSVYMDGVNAYLLGPIHSLQPSSVRNQGKVYLTKETQVNRWFSGAFSYYLPPIGTDQRRAALAKKLLGAAMTPDTLWNLAPWSWLTDWFSNAGDVISNVTDIAVDGLVLWYGYIMEHSVVKHTYSFSGPTGYVGSAKPPNLVLVSETKIRKKATPYGFGLNWNGFSARQLAILGALGISRT